MVKKGTAGTMHHRFILLSLANIAFWSSSIVDNSLKHLIVCVLQIIDVLWPSLDQLNKNKEPLQKHHIQQRQFHSYHNTWMCLCNFPWSNPWFLKWNKDNFWYYFRNYISTGTQFHVILSSVQSIHFISIQKVEVIAC